MPGSIDPREALILAFLTLLLWGAMLGGTVVARQLFGESDPPSQPAVPGERASSAYSE